MSQRPPAHDPVPHPLTPAQRRRAERSAQILRVARGLLADGGYLHLNMDRVADRIGVSKGTIYQHFSSKEDLIAALVSDTAESRLGMFRRAAAFDGPSRERVTAIGVADDVFVRRFPDHFAVESLLDIGSVFAKVDPLRREHYAAIKGRTMETLMGVVRDAVDAGDLTLPEGAPLCSPLYGLWTQSVGHHRMDTSLPVPPFDQIDANATLWMNYARLLDGYGWRPLSTEHDYGAAAARIRDEVFAEEMRGITNPD